MAVTCSACRGKYTHTQTHKHNRHKQWNNEISVNSAWIEQELSQQFQTKSNSKIWD